MSKLPRPGPSGIGRGIPRPGGIPVPSRSGLPRPAARAPAPSESRISPPRQAVAVKSHQPSVQVTQPIPKMSRIEVKQTRIETKLPPLSTMTKPKVRPPIIDKEKLMKKLKRRQAPEGEDIKKIREILRSLKNQEVTVHEFIGLVSPYTGDNGAVLRQVLAEDLASFRKMAKNIYETMTQDVSDVLTNEHLQLISTQNERFEYFTAKMLHAIDEIYELCPDFDFDKYYQNPGEYLMEKFPDPVVEGPQDPEEEEMLMRQEAYHRLQWLRSENARLSEENKRLQKRLNDLKQAQKAEMDRASEIERMAEAQKKELEAAEEALKEELDDINEEIDKSMVMEEAALRVETDVIETKPVKKKIQVRKAKKREGWPQKAAAEIEVEATSDTVDMEVSKVSLHSRASSIKGKRKKVKSKGDFHFSPIKTPPKKEKSKKPPSPFHYSPPKTPPQQEDGGPKQHTRVEKTTTVTEPPPEPQPGPSSQCPSVSCGAIPKRTLPPPRRSMAPKDSWGGFY